MFSLFLLHINIKSVLQQNKMYYWRLQNISKGNDAWFHVTSIGVP